jgi:hypothetical protein
MRMPLFITRTAELFTVCSLSSILERTKFKTASVAIVRRVAATIKSAFLPFRMLSPLSLPDLGVWEFLNNLTLRSEKGIPPPRP